MPALTKDWREFLSLLISHRVKFVVVGGHAVAVHASPRVTQDFADLALLGVPLRTPPKRRAVAKKRGSPR